MKKSCEWGGEERERERREEGGKRERKFVTHTLNVQQNMNCILD